MLPHRTSPDQQSNGETMPCRSNDVTTTSTAEKAPEDPVAETSTSGACTGPGRQFNGITRRAALTAACAATVAAALPATVSTDPVFAAIAAHRAAVAEFDKNCTDLSDGRRYRQTIALGKPSPYLLGIPEAEAAYDCQSEAEQDAAMAILDTPPTSLAGAVALLRYLTEVDEDRWPSLEDDDGQEVSWLNCAHQVLADAIEAISGLPIGDPPMPASTGA